MENLPVPEIDIGRLLATMRPPSIPDETFAPDNAELFSIASWKKGFAASVLAGLSTEAAFYANGIRIDWLLRLVLSKSIGRRKPSSDELSRVLNSGLNKAGVLRLEDPPEELFCDLIATTQGNYRIFSGHWKAAAPYTQTLLNAFESLPSNSLQRDTLLSVHSFLRLSEEIARRAHVDRLTPSSGEPMGILVVPDAKALRRLAERIRFTNANLNHLGIDKKALVPFLLDSSHFPLISDREVGETPLEFYPLLATSAGIVVLSPTTISLAIRSVLVHAATTGGMDREFQYAMMVEQQKYSEMWAAAGSDDTILS